MSFSWKTDNHTGNKYRVKHVLEFTGNPVRPWYALTAEEKEILAYIETGEAENVDQLDELLQHDSEKSLNRLIKLRLVDMVEREVKRR